MKSVDRFGRLWDKPELDLCPKCGQPNKSSECMCKKIDSKEAEKLGALTA